MCILFKTYWKDWCWSCKSNTLATQHEELTHLKRPWCWERLKVGGEGDDRGWDGWMASPTWWTWVWVNSGSWWWTEMPGVLLSMGSQRVRHDWVTELNWLKAFNLQMNIYLTAKLILRQNNHLSFRTGSQPFNFRRRRNKQMKGQEGRGEKSLF